jgi:hypothetical protein
MTRAPAFDAVFRWDLDKTYLATDFDSTLDLLRTAVQRPKDKVNVPGADALLRELLRADPNDTRAVTFISGSPEQMRRVLEEKLRLDGIKPEHFALKPNLKNLLHGRFRALRGQVGYKLLTLLKLHLQASGAREYLFGDDAEEDALIYSLYADLLAGVVGRALVAQVLEAAKVYPDTATEILELCRRLSDTGFQGPVRRIFIHLERRSPPARFAPYGARLVPIHNWFQAALVLFDDGQTLGGAPLLRIALSMHRHHGFTPSMLANSFQDLLRSRRLDPQAASRLALALEEAEPPHDLPAGLDPKRFVQELAERLEAIQGSEGPAAAPADAVPDYLALAHR